MNCDLPPPPTWLAAITNQLKESMTSLRSHVCFSTTIFFWTDFLLNVVKLSQFNTASDCLIMTFPEHPLDKRLVGLRGEEKKTKLCNCLIFASSGRCAAPCLDL